MPKTKLIKVKIIETQKTIFYGKARSITAQNETGPFDILPGHINFVTLINGALTIIQEDGTPFSIEITDGVLRNKMDYVKIYLGIKNIDIF